MTKLCSFCLRQTLPMAKDKTENTCLWKKKQRFFVLSFSEFQNEESKKQTNEVRSFFSFCQDNKVVVQDNETFFCFTIVQNQQAFGNCLWFKKKATFFSCLPEKLRSYIFAKKSVNIRDLYRKVMDNFTFL